MVRAIVSAIKCIGVSGDRQCATDCLVGCTSVGLAERNLLENTLVADFLTTSYLPSDKSAPTDAEAYEEMMLSDDEENVMARVAYHESQVEDEQEAGADTNTDNMPLYRVVWDFAAMADGEVSATAGDVVAVIDTENAEWWYVVLGRGGVSGFIPSNYLEPYTDEEQDAEQDAEPTSTASTTQIVITTTAATTTPS
jgi:hypothetical protein